MTEITEMTDSQVLIGAASIIREISRLYKEHRSTIQEEAERLGITELEANRRYLNAEHLPEKLFKSMVYLEAYDRLVKISMTEE